MSLVALIVLLLVIIFALFIYRSKLRNSFKNEYCKISIICNSIFVCEFNSFSWD